MKRMRNSPLILEINVRPWLHRLRINQGDPSLSLLDVPDEIWVDSISKRFDYLWLVGAWETHPFEEELLVRQPYLKDEFNKALPNWTYADLIGSFSAVKNYEIDPYLGKPGDIEKLRKKLNDLDIRLMLDFIPNHFGKSSPLAITKPHFFMSLKEHPGEFMELFEEVKTKRGKLWIANGKDPYFPSWLDTFQLNYFHNSTRQYMRDLFFDIAKKCDGVRCDMAMLIVNAVIERVWGKILKKKNARKPSAEFWTGAIVKIKREFSEFLVAGEVYWGMDWTLQRLGFDYTYDKVLYDRLRYDNAEAIDDHISKNQLSYQKKTIRFVENHSEERAITVFGREKSMMAAVVASTLPGARLFCNGQFEGSKIRTPINMIRTKKEEEDEEVRRFYDHLLDFVNQDLLHEDNWAVLDITRSWPSNETWKNLIGFVWTREPQSDEQFITIVVNYSGEKSQGRVKIPQVSTSVRKIIFHDALTNMDFDRDAKTVRERGLFVELDPYSCHLFNAQVVK